MASPRDGGRDVVIAIVDYGMGNLRSVSKALEHVGADVRVVTDPKQILAADKVVLPGVGAFADAAAHLRDQGLIEPLLTVIDQGRPFLGICLGLQLLFDVSYEDGEHTGLGVVRGDVVRFDFRDRPDATGLKIPHMGWNQVHWLRDCPLCEGIDSGEYFYFVHSYYVRPTEHDVRLGQCEYGIDFTAMIWRENVYATQFHPEKSQRAGLKILENFTRL